MLLSYRPELVVDDRVQEVIALIKNFPSRRRDQPFVKLIVQAAFDLLPDWVMSDLGLTRPPKWQRYLVRQALAISSMPLDWALATEGVSAHARRRLADASASSP